MAAPKEKGDGSFAGAGGSLARAGGMDASTVSTGVLGRGSVLPKTLDARNVGSTSFSNENVEMEPSVAASKRRN